MTANVASEVEEAREAVHAWLEISPYEMCSDEALAYAAIIRIRGQFGLRLDTHWDVGREAFSAIWKNAAGAGPVELPSPFCAEHPDHARLLACAAVAEAAAWLPRGAERKRAGANRRGPRFAESVPAK
jgi:hypothetical protein